MSLVGTSRGGSRIVEMLEGARHLERYHRSVKNWLAIALHAQQPRQQFPAAVASPSVVRIFQNSDLVRYLSGYL
jgi:hypothetical protein